jgi:hypothetical protein
MIGRTVLGSIASTAPAPPVITTAPPPIDATIYETVATVIEAGDGPAQL